MSLKAREYLQHIRDEINFVQTVTRDLSETEFVQDEVRSACKRRGAQVEIEMETMTTHNELTEKERDEAWARLREIMAEPKLREGEPAMNPEEEEEWIVQQVKAMRAEDRAEHDRLTSLIQLTPHN